MYPESELIINPDGSIYHLKLKPGQLAKTIITVGDMDRVDAVARHLDTIEHAVQNREFRTITGYKSGKRLSIISTGIGTDNIDIVFNEIDALFNIDFESRENTAEHTTLNFIRIGTSGTLSSDIPVDSLLLSEFAIDLGNLSSYYSYTMNAEEKAVSQHFERITTLGRTSIRCGRTLLSNLNSDGKFLSGITLTAPGFYGPQGRSLRLKSILQLESVSGQSVNNVRYTNLEMETAGIYLLASLLGHQAISCNALLANRITGEFSMNPKATVHHLIEAVLSKILSIDSE